MPNQTISLELYRGGVSVPCPAFLWLQFFSFHPGLEREHLLSDLAQRGLVHTCEHECVHSLMLHGDVYAHTRLCLRECFTQTASMFVKPCVERECMPGRLHSDFSEWAMCTLSVWVHVYVYNYVCGVLACFHI